MDVLSPLISILRHSDGLFHRESCPRLDVVYAGRLRGLPRLRAPGTVRCIISSSLFPHRMTIVLASLL